MNFTTNYIDDSLYYCPWKTKFIEAYCILYARLLRKIEEKQSLDVIVSLYFELFKLMLNILQKKLKSDFNISLTFYSDVIICSQKKGYIDNSKQCFEVLNFLSQYSLDKKCVKDFNYKYVDVLDDFSKKFKDYSRKEGFRDKNYVIYNNSSYLWGIHQSSLIKLIRVFLSYEKLKIVRIFGSRVTDEYKEFSDIDLIFEGTYSGKEYLKMRDRICKLEIPYVLDIYDINIGNKPFTYRNVVRSNLLYSRKDYYSEDSYISIIEKDDS